MPVEVHSVAGHFGELVQGRLGPDGPVALITLPAPELRVRARLAAGGPFALHCAGGERPLAPGRAAALFRALGGRPRGRLTLWSDSPAGGGAGSSTAALLAAAAAIVAGRGRPLPDPDWLARLCRALEGATDPLMHPEPGRLLWASRQARALALLPPAPPLAVVGGFLGRGLRTDAADERFAEVGDLVAAWAPAAARGDAAALAALATESARRNAAVRGEPDLAPLVAAAARVGALGVVAAHTGSARGLIFAPRRGDFAGAAAALRGLGARGVRRWG
jgi:uncharacterized protein involved in propanediol utilization